MRAVFVYFVAVFSMFSWLSSRPALAGGIDLELNKVEDGPGGCQATVLIGNQLGRTLDRFRLDLVLFNGQGTLFERLLIDLAPLPNGRTTVARFPLSTARCAAVTRILVQDVPACLDHQGKAADCLTDLTVTTRTRIRFGK